MERFTTDTLDYWREEGRKLLDQNFAEFSTLVRQAKNYLNRGEYEVAAIYGEMAAAYATGEHCGLFASSELEQVLVTIGQKTIRGRSNFRLQESNLSDSPKHILHVASTVMGIGGHSRMLWRWIHEDVERSHSLALTRQFPEKVPEALENAVYNSGGKIYIINRHIGSLITWARQLQKVASIADLVVLHVANHDVVPMIALANKDQIPPVIFINHADHQFWLGTSISDVVVSLRESGMCLAQERRGIEANRSLLLPIILDLPQRRFSRDEAKKQIGVPEDCILLLSIARAIKYKTIDGISFADVHIPLLLKYEKAILIVIGPDPDNCRDWETAINKTQGRIRILTAREDTALFYHACDVYVDSFPFVSNTSLLEAGSYGTPLVTRYPYPSEASAILGADMPGLAGNLIQAHDLKEYTEILQELVENREYRQTLGEITKGKIRATHSGDNWHRDLQKIYTSAISSPTTINSFTEKICKNEPDAYLPYIYGTSTHGKENQDKKNQEYLRLMPISHRLKKWLELVQKYGLSNSPLYFLLPTWFRAWYQYFAYIISLLSL